MGPARGGTLWNTCPHLQPANRKVFRELVHHELQPVIPVGANLHHLLDQHRMFRVEEIPQQVHAVGLEIVCLVKHLRTELDPGDEPHPERGGSLGRFRPPRHGVVVGQCHRVNASPGSSGNDLGRRLGAV